MYMRCPAKRARCYIYMDARGVRRATSIHQDKTMGVVAWTGHHCPDHCDAIYMARLLLNVTVT